MMRYLVQHRDPIFVKGYGFLYFAKNMGKNIVKIISRNFSENSQKPLDYGKTSATDAFKTAWKRATKKTEVVTGDLIGNKIANKSFEKFTAK